MEYLVDIPDPNYIDSCWINVGRFKTKKDAILWIKKMFGGNDKGEVSLISEHDG